MSFKVEQMEEKNMVKLVIESTAEEFEAGTKVEVKFGGLKGIVGEIVEHSGKRKILLKIDHISHSLLVTLPVEYVTKTIE